MRRRLRGMSVKQPTAAILRPAAGEQQYLHQPNLLCLNFAWLIVIVVAIVHRNEQVRGAVCMDGHLVCILRPKAIAVIFETSCSLIFFLSI